MKSVTQLAGLCLALTIGAVATADGLLPIPAAPGSEFAPGPPPPAPHYDPGFSDGVMLPGPVVHYDEAPATLFTNVRYTSTRKAHPCAVERIIRINDPCGSKHSCCEECVYIKICVPPCSGEDVVRCRRNGDRLRFYYGKYRVDVRVRKGYVVVDYKK